MVCIAELAAIGAGSRIKRLSENRRDSTRKVATYHLNTAKPGYQFQSVPRSVDSILQS
jgi:hypothetical protein